MCESGRADKEYTADFVGFHMDGEHYMTWLLDRKHGFSALNRCCVLYNLQKNLEVGKCTPRTPCTGTYPRIQSQVVVSQVTVTSKPI